MQWIPREKKAVDKDEALKLALEALQWNWGGEPLPTLELQAINAIKEALAQPEQELVSWRNAAIRVGEDLCSVGPFGYYDMTAKQWLDWALSVVTVHAPPPQRTWVGLDDEDMKELRDANFDLLYGARWAERKLREKNGC